MALSCDRKKLSILSIEAVLAAIYVRRDVLRYHRSQLGDDRCFIDDFRVTAMVEGLPTIESVVTSPEVGMQMCRDFYRFRRSDTRDPILAGAILTPALWDYDIYRMDHIQHLDELEKIQLGIFKFGSIKDRPKTIDDDRELYSLLPEKLPADFRLPPEPEFLGEAAAPKAGCPSFWRSHADCGKSCSLFDWGPCSKEEGKS